MAERAAPTMERARRSPTSCSRKTQATAALTTTGVTIFCQQMLQDGGIENRIGHEPLRLGVLVLERLQTLRFGDVHAAELGLPGVRHVAVPIPWRRHRSAVFAPAACSRSTPMT